MKRWEYAHVGITDGDHQGEVPFPVTGAALEVGEPVSVLNKWGDAGWELVGYQRIAVRMLTFYICIFKREKELE